MILYLLGRSWKASELRLKSWDDLHKLWYVLLKEKNMLMTQRQMLHAQNLRFPNPECLPKVWPAIFVCLPFIS
ncbi:putative ribosomal protein L47 [Helianthus debilis subsp. tardiflorus]